MLSLYWQNCISYQFSSGMWMERQVVECISKRHIHIVCSCVVGAWLCEVSGAWCYTSSFWSSVMTSHFEQRLGALCNFFTFDSLCFILECSCVTKVICNLWLPWSSLSALLDKCSGCVLSTKAQTCCLCHPCKSGLSYHYFICHLHSSLKGEIFRNTFWMILRFHPTPSLRPDQSECYCHWHLLNFLHWAAWIHWSY